MQSEPVNVASNGSDVQRIEGLDEANDWVEGCGAVWEARVQRLDAHMQDIVKGNRRG